MAFNYVLIKNQSYSNQNKVIGLYATKSGVAKAVGSAIDKLYQNKSKKQADNCLLMDNIYFKGNSSFSIAYSKNGNGADLCFQQLGWNSFKIQGKNGQTFINKLIYEHDEAQERRADKKRSNEELVKNTLERHPLPVSFYDSKYSWCIIDLDKYLADVQQDVEELEEAGDYAFYADTILKDDQFDALDSAKFLQGNLVLLVGSNRFVTDNFNDLRKGAGTTIVHPFYEKNKLYSITKEGIATLQSNSEKMNISSLVDWCKQLKDATLPEQGKERKAVADIGEAMFPISIAKDDSVKDYSFLDAIKPLRNFRLDKDIFADYYNN